MHRDVYYDALAGEIPRLLGLLDRNAASRSFGCFDRQYWNALAADFPCARHQEAALTLALLYSLHKDGNPYCRSRNLLGWINASLEFWSGIQERGGGFSEMYPHENAFVATAFSAYAISETLRVLGEGSVGQYGRILESLRKAGDWLMPRIDRTAVNQTAGSVIALYNIHLLTRERRYLVGAQDKLARIERLQDEEGWFMEYGGADIGYLSLAIDYLAKYYTASRDARALAIVRKALLFIAPFITSHGALAGSVGSRNTEYVIPSGFEIIARHCPESRPVARAMRIALHRRATVLPSCLDDRYLAYLGYTYLQAYIHAFDEDDADDPPPAGGAVRYPRAGITVLRNDAFHCAHAARKGGTFRFVFSNGRVVDDWGIALISDDDTLYFSGWMNAHASCSVSPDGTVLETLTRFQRVRQYFAGPLSYALFRICLGTLGRCERVSGHLRTLIRRVLVPRGAARTPFTLERRIRIADEGITVYDLIAGARRIRKVIVGAKATFLYVLSAHYYVPSDLDRPVCTYSTEGKKGDTIRVTREYTLAGDLRGIDITQA